jgi:type II secretory pathway component PulK
MAADDGVALIIVLMVLLLLLTVASQFSQGTRLEALTAANFRATQEERWLAEAGYQRALAEILPDAVSHELDLEGRLAFRRETAVPPLAPNRIDLPLGSGRFSYRITDESARLNLNRSDPAVLDRLLLALGVEKDIRDVIVDSIQDWRDPNEEYRLNGAESEYYLGLPVPYRSKNADFDDVDELVQVRGVTPALLRGQAGTAGLAEYLTVIGSGTVNVNTATRPVLRALGLADAEVELLLARRPYVDLAQLPSGLRRVRQSTRTETFRVEAWAGGPEPAGRVLLAVVQRSTDRGGRAEVRPVVWRWLERPRPTRSPATSPVRSPQS